MRTQSPRFVLTLCVAFAIAAPAHARIGDAVPIEGNLDTQLTGVTDHLYVADADSGRGLFSLSSSQVGLRSLAVTGTAGGPRLFALRHVSGGTARVHQIKILEDLDVPYTGPASRRDTGKVVWLETQGVAGGVVLVAIPAMELAPGALRIEVQKRGDSLVGRGVTVEVR